MSEHIRSSNWPTSILDFNDWKETISKDTKETWERRIAEYDDLDVNDNRKINSWDICLIYGIDFDKYPDLRHKVQKSIESSFNAMRHMSAEGDTMGQGAQTEEQYHKYARAQGAKPRSFKYNDGEEIAPEYYSLVRRYADLMSNSPQECIDFLLKLIQGWHQMYLRYHAFRCFSKKTNSAIYATTIADAILREEEMDSRTLMLEWLATVDYSGQLEKVPYVLKVAEALVSNPCAGEVPLYIGNDKAIPGVREAAKSVLLALQKI